MQSLLAAIHGYFLSPVLTIFFFALLVYVVLGWLMMGGVVDNRVCRRARTHDAWQL